MQRGFLWGDLVGSVGVVFDAHGAVLLQSGAEVLRHRVRRAGGLRRNSEGGGEVEVARLADGVAPAKHNGKSGMASMQWIHIFGLLWRCLMKQLADRGANKYGGYWRSYMTGFAASTS